MPYVFGKLASCIRRDKGHIGHEERKRYVAPAVFEEKWMKKKLMA